MSINRGFTGRNRPHGQPAGRIPPGRRLRAGFPMLTAGPTPRTPLDQWSPSLQDGGQLLAKWSWEAFPRLPQIGIRADIHCVTKWTKLDTSWRGVTIDDLLRAAS